MHLLIKVKEIKGNCPVYKVGDEFKIEEGYRLVTDKPLCMHSLASILPFYNALRWAEPKKLGLAGKDEKKRAYIQCADVFSYTGGGTVIFEITKFEV